MISRKIRRSLDQTEARFIRTLSRDLDEEEEGDDSDDAAGLSWLASANAKQGKHVFGVQSLPAAHVKMVSAVYAPPPPFPSEPQPHLQSYSAPLREGGMYPVSDRHQQAARLPIQKWVCGVGLHCQAVKCQP